MTPSSQPRVVIEDLPALETLSDEEKARIFGAGRTRLGLEALETRELMAASVTAVLTGSTLRIEGTDKPDRIILQRDGSNLRVQGVTITNQAGAPVTAPLAGVNAIRIDGLGGSDLFWIQHNLAESFDLRGGAAADLIVAGSQSRITTERDATDRRISPDVVTVWKQLEALTPNANGQYTLSSIKVGSFTLSNATATVSASGVTLSGDLSLAALGTVRLTGTVTPDNTFQASFPERTLLGGLAAVKNATVTLSGDRATVTADLIISKVGVTTRLTGWVKADGTSVLEATASFKVAGFQVTGGKWTLRDKLEVNFALPMPALGNTNVTFRGSYGATGWSIEGKVPVNIQIGVVTLKQITVGVTKDHAGDQLILGAKGTIASIDGFVDATATARLYTDGRINLNVKADALKLGSYKVGNVQVTVANDTPAGRSVYVATFQGTVSIPGMSAPVQLTGELRSNGYYRLKGEQTIQVGGLTLSQARFELIKGGPLTFNATWVYSGLNITVSGTAEAGGRVQFKSTASTMTLPNGFKLLNFTASADLNPGMNSYKAHVEGKADVLIGTVTFTSNTVRGASGWPAASLSGTAQVGGALASLFTGSAKFTVESNRVLFAGRLALKHLSGVSVDASGSVKADGTLTIGGYTVKTADLAQRNLAAIAKALRGGGASLSRVALALWNMGGNTRTAVLGAIASGIGGNYADMGTALLSISGTRLSDVAYALKNGANIGLGSVALALWNMGGNTRTVVLGAIAGGIGGNYADMGRALLSIPSTGLGDVAYALKNGASINLGSVALALWNMGGNTRAAVLGAIAGGIGGNYADMGRALLSIPSTKLGDVAYALKNGASIGLGSVALALWNMGGNTRAAVLGAIAGGIGGNYADMGRALLSISGTKLGDVAYALKNGANIGLGSVALALWNMGGNTRTAVLGAIAGGIGGTYADMGRALLSIPGTGLGDVAYALKNGANINLNSVALALWNMGGNTRTTVIRAMVDGIGGSYADIAGAVYYGIGGANLADLAYALKNGASINASSVALALWNMGGVTRGNVVWALINGISVREWDAWAIVNSL